MTYVSLQSLADKLKVGFVAGSIKLGDLRDSLLNLLSNYYYESNILEDARSLMINDAVDDMLRFYSELSRGNRGNRFDFDPDLCEKVVVFKCGHVFPKNYIAGSQCQICNKNESNKMLNLIWSLKKGQVSGGETRPKQKTIVNGKSQLNEEGRGNFEKQNSMLASLNLSGTDSEKKEKPSRSVAALVDDVTRKSSVGSSPTNAKIYQREKFLRQLHIFDNKKDEETQTFEEFRTTYDDF